MKLKRIDIKGGHFTFAQRIEIGKIMTEETEPLVKAVLVINCLHGFRPRPKMLIRIQDYIKEIFEGLLFWINAEKRLKYDPTPEEEAAGIMDLSKSVGDLGTIQMLSEKYSQDPDTILGWEYSKVYGLLLVSLENYKFSKRMDKVIEKKYQHQTS